MISERQLATAIEARRIRVGAANIAIGRSAHSDGMDWWSATFVDADHTCATENAATLQIALAAAELSLLRKREQNNRRANIALAYARDMGVSA